MADFDAVVVGAGCAGSVAAYVLAREGRERAHDRAGLRCRGEEHDRRAQSTAHALRAVFPGFESEAPLERKIVRERVSLITEDESTTVEFASPRLGEDEAASYSVLRGPFDRWLASKAEDAGAECIYGIAVEESCVERRAHRGRACAARTR